MPTSIPRLRPVLCLTAWMLVAWTAPLRPQPLAEYDVKAAFLYNFVKFVQWPGSAFEGPDTPIVLCLAGSDPFAGSLDRIVEGERVEGRSLSVERLASPALTSRCHLLFVPAGEQGRQRAWLRAAAGRAVLTVGEAPGFLDAGGIVQFLLEDQRVRFAIHTAPAETAGLRLNARLLQVARIVMPEVPR